MVIMNFILHPSERLIRNLLDTPSERVIMNFTLHRSKVSNHNCAELHATVLKLRAIFRSLLGSQLRASKIHLRWKPYTGDRWKGYYEFFFRIPGGRHIKNFTLYPRLKGYYYEFVHEFTSFFSKSHQKQVQT